MVVGRQAFPIGKAYFQGRTVKLPGGNILPLKTDCLTPKIGKDSNLSLCHNFFLKGRDTNVKFEGGLCLFLFFK